MAQLDDFCFAHEGMFLIPIEAQSKEGLDPSFAQELVERELVPEGWVEVFDRGFAQYWSRASELSGFIPQYWFPPRIQNIGIVYERERVRPYFMPLHKSAWLLYREDFDPKDSTIEFASFIFFHAERLELVQEVVPAMVRNLSYFLVCSDEEAEQFQKACEQSRRPDAGGFRSLAKFLPCLRQQYHENLKPPRVAVQGGWVSIPDTGLLFAKSEAGRFKEWLASWQTAAESVVKRYFDHHATGGGRAEPLVQWLLDHRPKILIAGERGEILWDPEQPEDVDRVRTAVSGIRGNAADSLREDWLCIDRHTRRFLNSLQDADALPAPHEDTEQTGLSYMHLERRMIAFNLSEGRMSRTKEPAAPFERWMLGARTIHEWGHLAADAGWIGVAPESEARQATLIDELGAIFEQIHEQCPPAVRNHIAAEMAPYRDEPDGIGGALAKLAMSRLPDFQSNLMARGFLSREELETYIRNNVYSLILEYTSTGLLQRLARYSYEYQYLRFSAVKDPEAYFLKSTWFGEQYLMTKVIQLEEWNRLTRTMGELCDLYRIDPDRIRLPKEAAAEVAGREDEDSREQQVDA